MGRCSSRFFWCFDYNRSQQWELLILINFGSAGNAWLCRARPCKPGSTEVTEYFHSRGARVYVDCPFRHRSKFVLWRPYNFARFSVLALFVFRGFSGDNWIQRTHFSNADWRSVCNHAFQVFTGHFWISYQHFFLWGEHHINCWSGLWANRFI